MHAWFLGFGLGFFVAMGVGPMSLLLIRSTLRHGARAGLAIGAGIALIDGLYASCGAAGAAPLLNIPALRAGLGLAGAATLLVIGLRTLRSALRVRLGGEGEIEVATPRRAFLTALAGTASNPATIISWAAIFSAASTVGAVGSSGGAVLLVTGVAAGSACWTSVLTGSISLARGAVGAHALPIADALAGIGMLGFGGALAYSSVNSLETR